MPRQTWKVCETMYKRLVELPTEVDGDGLSITWKTFVRTLVKNTGEPTQSYLQL